MRRPHAADPLSRCLGRAAWIVAVTVAWLGAGCRWQVRPSDPLVRTWLELKTERFVLTTDLDERRARARIRELEELGTALEAFHPAGSTRVASPIRPRRLIHLAVCDEVQRLFPGKDRPGSGMRVRGFALTSSSPLVENLIVTCESDRLGHEIVLHELTHDLNHRYFAVLPPWLEEGLATYYQTLALVDGKAVLGKPPAQDAVLWTVPPRYLPSLKEVLEAPSEWIYEQKFRIGYFASWKLTHLLNNRSDDHRRRLMKMLQAIIEGNGSDAAFHAAFGDLRRRLEKEYTSYFHHRSVHDRNLPYRKPPFGGIRGERELELGEVHGLFIEAAFLRARPGEMMRRLERLDREAPAWPGRHYWRALVQYRHGIPGRPPLELLREYVELEPDDPRGWLALVVLEIDELRPPDDLGLDPKAPSGLEDIEWDAVQLARRARTASQLNQIGVYFALRRRPKIGLPWTLAALAEEPGCAPCIDTLAALYFHSGSVAAAVAEQRRAVAMFSERARQGPPSLLRLLADMKARLEHYESAVRAAGQLAR